MREFIIGLLLGLIGGVIFIADAVSSEKREGYLAGYRDAENGLSNLYHPLTCELIYSAKAVRYMQEKKIRTGDAI